MGARLAIEHVPTANLDRAVSKEIRTLCDAAYGEETAGYFKSLGEGDHLLGRRDGVLVSHLMWVTRWLEPEGLRELRTAYVEMVATAPAEQKKGYASMLLDHFPPLAREFELAALSPATEGIYLKLGWQFWRGPLSARKDGAIEPTPDERVMILPLDTTPALDLHVPLSVEWRKGEVW